MGDDALRMANQLVMTPQLQMAIRLLSTPSADVAALIASTPGLALEPSSPDPLRQLFTRDEDDDGPPWEFRELPSDVTADVWLDGNPPRALANRRALPDIRVTEPTRDAQWVVRALVQRARTFERVVGALAQLRPQLAIAMSADEITPVKPRDIAEAIGLHESTVARVAQACTLQTRRGIRKLVASKRGISVA
jgi:hypothetical protein